MPVWLWVAVGGAIGSVGRYALANGMARILGQGFPWGTFVVNIIGCFAVGVLALIMVARGADAGPMRFFLMTGILGGFTTFSAFSLDSLVLVQRGELALAATYVLASVALSLVAVWAGYAMARGVFA